MLFYYLWMLFVFINMGPYGSQNFKRYSFQITAGRFQTSPEFSYQWSSPNYFFDSWNFETWNFNDFLYFSEMSLTWDRKLQNATLSTNHSQKFSNLSWTFLPMGFKKCRWWLLKYWVPSFSDFFFRKFKIHHCALWRKNPPQLSGKRAIVEQNGVKLGTHG